jgi:hypothetical protein
MTMTPVTSSNLSEQSTSTLLGLLYFTKPGTEPYRNIVKVLFSRENSSNIGGTQEAADEYRDRLFRDACDFRSQFEEEWDRLLKSDPVMGEDFRDPCPKCHPEEYEEKFGPHVAEKEGAVMASAAEMAVLERICQLSKETTSTLIGMLCLGEKWDDAVEDELLFRGDVRPDINKYFDGLRERVKRFRQEAAIAFGFDGSTESIHVELGLPQPKTQEVLR